MRGIVEIRADIDRIDDALVAILRARWALAREAMASKLAIGGAPARDSAREREIAEKRSGEEEVVRRIYAVAVASCREAAIRGADDGGGLEDPPLRPDGG